MCYQVKFGPIGCTRKQKISPTLGALGPNPRVVGHTSPTRNMPLPHMRYHAEFCRFRSNETNVIEEIRLKYSTLVFRLSRSLKVIETDTDRSATYDFMFNNNREHISYRFRDNDT